ncbi:DUF2059 domain-containing protein [Ferrimonas balearica]|uniref:DUF2059 domain-containing protein n=1 Tax=Ferrimonas balearica TaxID=44012 RepID=UPI001C996A5E|nr:DUF2059 domain-containing protein [Ferrimonas balearica]MBY5993158.1 DUF2059 domain-containing protein [Ferrimonas balearica]
MMRLLNAALLALMLAQPAWAMDDDAVDAARDLLAASRTEQMLVTVLDQIQANMLAQNPEMVAHAQVMRDFMAEHLSYDAMEPELIALYAEAFTVAELRELAFFYRSPVGQKSLDLMPELMQKSNALTINRLQAHLPALMARLEALDTPH